MASPLQLLQMTVLQLIRAWKILRGSSLLSGQSVCRELELLKVPHLQGKLVFCRWIP